jgi:hypothetical protein
MNNAVSFRRCSVKDQLSSGGNENWVESNQQPFRKFSHSVQYGSLAALKALGRDGPH